jgi:hypothetical protein
MPNDHHFQIDGQKWLWRYSPLKGTADGWTEFDKRKVLIDSRLKGRTRLETEIHEGLHASFGKTISEESVTQTAHDLAKILWLLGYRIQEESP